jgi:hypothetical protein
VSEKAQQQAKELARRWWNEDKIAAAWTPADEAELAQLFERAEAAEQQLAIATRAIELTDENAELRIAQITQRAEAAEAALAAVPRYAHYFYTEALRLRIDGNMVDAPMTLDEWLAGAEQEEDADDIEIETAQ